MPLIRPGTEIDQLAAFGAKRPEFVSLGPLDTAPAGRAVDDSRGGVCHVAISLSKMPSWRFCPTVFFGKGHVRSAYAVRIPALSRSGLILRPLLDKFGAGF